MRWLGALACASLLVMLLPLLACRDDYSVLLDLGLPADLATPPDLPALNLDAVAACGDTAHEPDETEATAQVIPGNYSGCTATLTLSGVVAGATDVDYYRWRGVDDPMCASTYAPTLTLATPAPALRVCLFVECVDGRGESVDCLQGTSETSPTGRTGCCQQGGATLSLELGCDGGGDTPVDYYARFDQLGGDACLAYRATLTTSP
jgi:hypothetical protein